MAALPLTGSGALTRERLARLAETGDGPAALRHCIDEMAWLPGLVEALRAAGEACAEAPTETRREGLGALADMIADEIRRLTKVLRGALSAMS